MAQSRLSMLGQGASIGPLAGMEYVRARGDEGRQRGQQSVLSRLSAEAYGAPAEQQRGLVQQAIGVNPEAGFALGKGLDTDRATQMEGLATKARYVVGMAKAGQSQAIAPVYAQLAQEARALGLGEVPTEWNDSYIPGLEQIAQLGGSATGNTVQSQKVGEDGFIYNTFRDGRIVNTGVKADRQMWLRDHAGMAPELVGKDGATRPVGAVASQPSLPNVAGNGQQDDQVAQIGQEYYQRLIQSGFSDEQATAATGVYLTDMQQRGPQAAQVAPAAPRPSEAQTAGQVEAARQSAQLAYLPAQEAIKAQSAIQQAAGTAQAKGTAEAQLEAVQALPRVMQESDNTIRLIDQALNHPGLPIATGLQGRVDPRNYIPGSDAADFKVLLDQIKGGTFLQAFQSLKGGGAITETEGKKAEQAIARLDTSQSEGAFRQALQELQGIANSAKTRAIQKAQGGMTAPSRDAIRISPANASPQPAAADDLDALMEKYL